MSTRPSSRGHLAPEDVSRRRFLSGLALTAGAVFASPLLASCSKQEAATTTTSGRGVASSNSGKPTTEFPSKLWVPGDAAGAKPDLPRRMAFQNLVAGAAPLELVDRWMKQAADDTGFEYIVSNSNGNSAATITQMNQSISRGVMGMVTPGQDIPAQIAAMKAGMAKGAAMFLFNTGSITCGMAAVQYTFGYTQGKYAAQYVKDELGGDAKILYINQNGAITLRPRERGFLEALQEEGIDRSSITSVDSGQNGTQDVGFKVMNTTLQKDGDYDVVAAAGDELALGAMAALKTAGKWTAIPKLAVLGAEGSPQAVEHIKAGNTPFKATSAVHFGMVGYVPGRLIARWADGLSIPQFLEYNSFLIDSADTAQAFERDLDRCEELYEEMLDGNDQYVVPRGEISFETREGVYEGGLPDKLPALQA